MIYAKQTFKSQREARTNAREICGPKAKDGLMFTTYIIENGKWTWANATYRELMKCNDRKRTSVMESEMKPILRSEEVTDGINVIVDDRFAALIPMEAKAQVDFLIDAVNKAIEQRLRREK